MFPAQIAKAHDLVRQGVLPYVALQHVLRLSANPSDTRRPGEPSTTPTPAPLTYPEQGCQINISDGPPKNG